MHKILLSASVVFFLGTIVAHAKSADLFANQGYGGPPRPYVRGDRLNGSDVFAPATPYVNNNGRGDVFAGRKPPPNYGVEDLFSAQALVNNPKHSPFVWSGSD